MMRQQHSSSSSSSSEGGQTSRYSGKKPRRPPPSLPLQPLGQIPSFSSLEMLKQHDHRAAAAAAALTNLSNNRHATSTDHRSTNSGKFSAVNDDDNNNNNNSNTINGRSSSSRHQSRHDNNKLRRSCSEESINNNNHNSKNISAATTNLPPPPLPPPRQPPLLNDEDAEDHRYRNNKNSDFSDGSCQSFSEHGNKFIINSDEYEESENLESFSEDDISNSKELEYSEADCLEDEERNEEFSDFSTYQQQQRSYDSNNNNNQEQHQRHYLPRKRTQSHKESTKSSSCIRQREMDYHHSPTKSVAPVYNNHHHCQHHNSNPSSSSSSFTNQQHRDYYEDRLRRRRSHTQEPELISSNRSSRIMQHIIRDDDILSSNSSYRQKTKHGTLSRNILDKNNVLSNNTRRHKILLKDKRSLSSSSSLNNNNNNNNNNNIIVGRTLQNKISSRLKHKNIQDPSSYNLIQKSKRYDDDDNNNNKVHNKVKKREDLDDKIIQQKKNLIKNTEINQIVLSDNNNPPPNLLECLWPSDINSVRSTSPGQVYNFNSKYDSKGRSSSSSSSNYHPHNLNTPPESGGRVSISSYSLNNNYQQPSSSIISQVKTIPVEFNSTEKIIQDNQKTLNSPNLNNQFQTNNVETNYDNSFFSQGCQESSSSGMFGMNNQYIYPSSMLNLISPSFPINSCQQINEVDDNNSPINHTIKIRDETSFKKKKNIKSNYNSYKRNINELSYPNINIGSSSHVKKRRSKTSLNENEFYLEENTNNKTTIDDDYARFINLEQNDQEDFQRDLKFTENEEILLTPPPTNHRPTEQYISNKVSRCLAERLRRKRIGECMAQLAKFCGQELPYTHLSILERTIRRIKYLNSEVANYRKFSFEQDVRNTAEQRFYMMQMAREKITNPLTNNNIETNNNIQNINTTDYKPQEMRQNMTTTFNNDTIYHHQQQNQMNSPENLNLQTVMQSNHPILPSFNLNQLHYGISQPSNQFNTGVFSPHEQQMDIITIPKSASSSTQTIEETLPSTTIINNNLTPYSPFFDIGVNRNISASNLFLPGNIIYPSYLTQQTEKLIENYTVLQENNNDNNKENKTNDLQVINEIYNDGGSLLEMLNELKTKKNDNNNQRELSDFINSDYGSPEVEFLNKENVDKNHQFKKDLDNSNKLIDSKVKTLTKTKNKSKNLENKELKENKE